MKNATTDNTVLLSKKGMKELKKNIARLEHDRSKAIQTLRETDKMANREGNLNYIEKMERIDNIEAELADKQLLFKNAKLAPSRKGHFKVAIGSVVELIDSYGKRLRFTIVHSVEANPSDGRISDLSPLGQTLLSKTVGDTVEVKHGHHVNRLQLVHVS